MTTPAVLVIAYEVEDDAPIGAFTDAVQRVLAALPDVPGIHRPPTVNLAIGGTAARVLAAFDFPEEPR